MARRKLPTLQLDPADPTPLYHQIARAIRWKIGTGALRVGDRLPTLREGERAWGVHLHTIRQAYQELVSQGLIETRARTGTRVAALLRADERGSQVARFIDEVVLRAHADFGLGLDDLVTRLLSVRHRTSRGREPVTIVECNLHQCRDIAGQLRPLLPGPLSHHVLSGRRSDPPAGILIGTSFHFAEMRDRWPDRVGDMYVVSLEIDPALGNAIGSALARTGLHRMVLCEKDLTTGREAAADIARLAGRAVPITPVTESPPRALQRYPDALVLVEPRIWDTVDARTRASDRVLEVRHLISREQTSVLLTSLWPRLSQSAAAATLRRSTQAS